MGGILFFIILLSLLVYWDFQMKIRLLFSHKWAERWLEEHISLMARRLFVLARFFTRFSIAYDSDVGELGGRRCLVVCNHQSLADIPVLRAALPDLKLRFVAKKELKWGFPGVSTALRVGRHAFVDRRGNMGEGMAELKRIGRIAQTQNVSPVVFPEGTRSKTGQVKPFRSGALRVIANECKLPILVVAIDGGHRFVKLRQIIEHLRGNTYRIKLIKMLPPADTRSQLMEQLNEAEQLIRRQVGEWREREHRGIASHPEALQLPRNL